MLRPCVLRCEREASAGLRPLRREERWPRERARRPRESGAGPGAPGDDARQGAPLTPPPGGPRAVLGGTLGATHVSGRFPDPVRAQPRCSLLLGSSLLSGERRLPSPSPASSLPGGEDPPLGGPRPAPAPCPPPWSLKPSPKAQCSLAQLPGATHGPLHGPAAPLSVLSRRVGPQKLHAPPRGRSVQLWPHHVVGAGGLLMRWPGGCLGAAMALCMPSRPPERAGFGVPGLAVPPAADPRRLRLF